MNDQTITEDRLEQLIAGGEPADPVEQQMTSLFAELREQTPPAPLGLREQTESLREPQAVRRKRHGFARLLFSPAAPVLAVSLMAFTFVGYNVIDDRSGREMHASDLERGTLGGDSGSYESSAGSSAAEPAAPDQSVGAPTEPMPQTFAPLPTRPVRIVTTHSTIFVERDDELADVMRGFTEQLGYSGATADSIDFSLENKQVKMVVRVRADQVSAMLARFSELGALVEHKTAFKDLTADVKRVERQIRRLTAADPSTEQVSRLEELQRKHQELIGKASVATMNVTFTSDRPDALKRGPLHWAKDQVAQGWALGAIVLALGCVALLVRRRVRNV